MAYLSGYGSKGQEVARLQLRIPKHLLKKIDEFGIPNGFASRNSAVINLLETAISEIKKTEEAQLGGTSSSVSE